MKEKIKTPHKPKILIFEDDQFLTEIYLNKFREEGFEVKIYSFPPDNLVKEVTKEKPDIISMGIIMPNLDGYQATKMLREDSRTKNLPIIGLDNLGQKEDIEKAVEVGMTDYLITARLTPNEYIGVIKDYLNNPQNYQPKCLLELKSRELRKEKEIDFNKIIKLIISHKKVLFVITLLLIVGLWFYWFGWRPTQIRKECYKNASIETEGNIYWERWNQIYNVCLKERGLEK